MSTKPAEKRRISAFGAIMIGLIVIASIIAIVLTKLDLAPSSARSDPTPEQSYDMTQSVRAASASKLIRDNARNPASFQLARALGMPGSVVCLTYRAQNGFGGMNVEHALLRRDEVMLQSDPKFGRAWNINCGSGSRGSDITAQVKLLLE